MSTAQQMIQAVQSGDAEALRRILTDDPAAADARAENGDSPLLVALYHGRRDLAEVMLAHGRAPDPFEAAAVGDVERLRAALDAEPDLVARHTHDGWTMLHYAAFFGHGEALQMLLARGADVHAQSRNGMRNTALHAALAGPLDGEGIRRLVEAGADVHARQHGGYTPLHSAAGRGDLALIDLLLARGADPDAAADDGRLPADFAREHGHDAAAERLRGRGAAV